jgi:glyoxylase-like metal-dependent hydrolase (beta-lactamase superfamily II)
MISSVGPVADDLVRLRFLIANLYLFGSSQEWVLIDGGMRGVYPILKRHAGEKLNGQPPKAIILTHGHFDHVGAFPQLFEDWDVPVYAHPLEFPHLTGTADYPPPDPRVGKGAIALLSGLFPRGAIDLGDRLRPLPEDGAVPHMPGWRWLHTPGHTEGHISLFRDADRLLIAGDAFVTTRQEQFGAVATQRCEISGPPAYFTPDWPSARQSVLRLAQLDPQIAATGHGRVMRGEGLRRGLATLVSRFDDIAVPRQGRYVPKGRRAA